MNHCNNIENFSFSERDRLFIDANVWLSIFSPLAIQEPKLEHIYSRALSLIKAVGASAYTDTHVLSEFVNRFAREEHKSSGARKRKFKEFRQSNDFKEVAKEIGLQVKKIAIFATVISNSITNSDILALMHEFENGNADFNDQVIITICRQNGFTVITHDGDFALAGIPVLTANTKML